MQGKYGDRTRYGGIRRSNRGSSDAQSSQQINGRSVARNHPPVLTWREQLGLPDCPYVIRWKLETRWFSVRLHHWLGPDDDRAFHDHPWSFVTFVLRGTYVDYSPNGAEVLKAPTIRYRPALHRHTVVPDPGGCWTVIVTGRRVRTWGFWDRGVKFVKANKWFASRGHHTCD